MKYCKATDLEVIKYPGRYFGVKRIGMTIRNPRKLP